MTTVELFQVWMLIVTSLGVLVALVFSIWQSYLMRNQMKLNHKQVGIMQQQMKVNLFADYTKRYQEIIINFPETINEDDFDVRQLKVENPDSYKTVMRYMRIYFDLCSEEFFLNQNGKIEKEDWEEWSEGIKYTFTKRAFKDAWEIATKDSKFYTKFADWINNEVLSKE